MAGTAAALEKVLDRHGGILRLRPNFVRRVYVDGGRLSGGRCGGTFNPRDSLYRPERWVASGTTAVNPFPIPGEGLSRLADAPMTLVEAFNHAGPRLLGARRFEAHGPEFRVLLKVLDGITPIPFHFHASDAAVRRDPKHFRGARFGKDEAYYFLEAPKGPCPYTHVGLHPGTTMRDLRRAIGRGGDALLELSPFFLQRFEEGLFLPGGIVHRPGTALTLEIQQPADVSIRLDDRMGDRRLRPEEMYPGFDSLEQAMRHVDLAASTQAGLIERYRLMPQPVSRRKPRGGSEDWIFPPEVCRKFSGKRLRVRSRMVTVEPDCYALLVWKGKGRVGPHRARAGDEFFVSCEAAAAGVAIESQAGEPLELFKCFAAPVNG